MELILSINPGSTSTKYALYSGEELLFESTLRHSAADIARFSAVVDQREWRESLILDELKSRGVELSSLRAVVGRGGLIKPIAGGIYEVNDALYNDTVNATAEHACNLGALIARSIAECSDEAKAYIADPVVVDEMDEVAHLGGHPLLPRHSVFHALNSKAVAHRYAKDSGVSYEGMNLIVAHLGGGVSVSAHRAGRVVDTTNALSGNGAFSPERSGRVEPMQLVEMCFSGEYSREQIGKMLIGAGGVVAHLGTNSMAEVVDRAQSGDEQAAKVMEAFVYNVAKDIGAMSTVLKGAVDAIIITGGVAYNDSIFNLLESRIKWIANIIRYPGEDELEALAMSALEVLRGEREALEYC
ncbi:MAG: butyrate kinase [Rikenellaceae bacterium]